METNIGLEIFGYVGTVLVILSMMMTSVSKLRIINICGGTISCIYSVFYQAWPVVIMNICLIIINLYQVTRQLTRKQEYGHVALKSDDESLKYFVSLHADDINVFLPGFDASAIENSEIHMAYVGSTAVGMVAGKRDGETFYVSVDYAIKQYRDFKVSKHLFSVLASGGVKRLVAEKGNAEHNKYLERMGFALDGANYVLNIA